MAARCAPRESPGALWTLFVAVGLVCSIACANIADLLCSRRATPTGDGGPRGAGGGRSRLARQLLTESLVLASAGGLAGVLAARWGLEPLLALAPADIPRLESVQVDGWSLVFTCLIRASCASWWARCPAAQVAKPTSSPGSVPVRGGDRRPRQLRPALVVGQLAV